MAKEPGIEGADRVTASYFGERYGVILADPPWAFNVWSKDTGQGRSAESHYPTMSAESLTALPVVRLAARDCALFMWATWPVLPQALALGSAWGFEYKTAAFVWAKTLASGFGWFFGMGYYTRANTEFVLLFTRGAVKRKERNVRQLIIAPFTKHSEKPQEQYSRIERLVDGPYIELFARRPRKGWASLGNEIDGLDIREALHRRPTV